MKLKIDQRKICNISNKIIDKILFEIEESDWYLDDYRNNAPNMNDVNTIPIFHTRYCVNSNVNINPILTIEKKLLFEKYYPLISPILSKLKKYYDYNHHASFLARLNPHGVIGIHVDHGPFLETCHRIHVPIKTNEKVIYWINKKEYYWKKGNIYEFDNTLPHGVFNHSDKERIHLVINLYNLNQDELKKTNKIY